MDLKTIVEALIFASGRPLGVAEIMEILEAVPEGPKPNRQEVETVLQTIQKEWEERGGGVRLQSIAEGYEFRTLPEYAPWIRLLNRPKPHRLSLPAVETLALVAYRQPITRTEIEAVRGVDTAAVLKGLLERRLIRVVGRREEPGRPLLYATTHGFLEIFSLKDLSDLPPLKELEEIIRSQASEEKEGDLSLTDLAASPEELSLLEEEDRAALEELDQKIQNLRNVEKEVLEKQEPVVPDKIE